MEMMLGIKGKLLKKTESQYSLIPFLITCIYQCAISLANIQDCKEIQLSFCYLAD